MVLDDGYAWNGCVYRSLSQVAKAITGTNWNGHRFFGLKAVGNGAPNSRRPPQTGSHVHGGLREAAIKHELSTQSRTCGFTRLTTRTTFRLKPEKSCDITGFGTDEIIMDDPIQPEEAKG